MSQDLSSINYPLPSITLNAASAGVPQVVQVGQNFTDGWVELFNESPFQLMITTGAGGMPKEITSQYVDIFPLAPGDKLFTFTPVGLIPLAAPSYRVDIRVYPYGKPKGAFPMALARQASPTSAASQTGGFTASQGFNTANNNTINFNLFNPLASGENATIYGARIIFTPNGAATPSIEFGYKAGAEEVLTTQVVPVPNNTQATSKMHVWFSASAAVSFDQIWNTLFLTTPASQMIIVPLVAFPDQKQVPGAINASISLINIGVGGGFGTFEYYWTEQ